MTLTAPIGTAPARRTSPDVEVVVPLYNEQHTVATSVHRLHSYLAGNFPLSWVITLADNASTDGTWGTACRLTRDLDRVRAVHIPQRGRGRALRTVWASSEATVVAYMDVDLSTDLDALLPLVAPLLSGHSDVAIGSRLAPGARVVRGPKREVISRAYNFLLRATLRNSFSDAQCGFKALRADVARQLLPLVEDDGWFFDTELLVLAERNGLRVHEVPVDWVEDTDSRVEIARTAREDLRGVARMLLAGARGKGHISTSRPVTVQKASPGAARPGAARPPARPSSTGQAVHFAAVGAMSTLAFALLFALLYGPVGPFAADIMALSLCAAGNLAANRRYTFATSGPAGRRHYYGRGLATGLLPLASTLAALGALALLGAQSLGLDIAVLTLVNLSCTVARFRLLSRASTAAR
jgi:putative flippase GtrA